ncbi:MAG TPA: hypothetical protein VL425_03030 [Rudaea sp.]|jgi:hypothetical protein|nr:hypothetical protein [Rudaea sp.]
MSNFMQKSMAMATVAAMLAMGVPSAHASQAQLDCKLRFSLSGWSAIYKHAEGRGVVTCADGSSMNVAIEAKGGGLTVGKSHIDGGKGKFSDVRTIDDVLGSYVNGEAHVGVVKSGTAQLLTKGTVSLALAGAGEGVDVGLDVGEMTLKRSERHASEERQ